jgi:hypothetical protein
VLCEVLQIPHPEDEAFIFGKCDTEFGREHMCLPSYQQTTLAAMNDGGETFTLIADYIEENIKVE